MAIRAVITQWRTHQGFAEILGVKGDDFYVDRDDFVDRLSSVEVGTVIRCELKRSAGRKMVARNIEVES